MFEKFVLSEREKSKKYHTFYLKLSVLDSLEVIAKELNRSKSLVISDLIEIFGGSYLKLLELLSSYEQHQDEYSSVEEYLTDKGYGYFVTGKCKEKKTE